MSRSLTPDLRRVTSTAGGFPSQKPMERTIPTKGRALLALSLFLLATPAALAGDAAPARPSNGAKSNAPVPLSASPQVPPSKFESWPTPPPRAAAVLTASTAPDARASEKAALAKAAGDKRLFEFHAENLELKAALALFARGNNLNIVPDQDVNGTVTLDVRNLSLDRMMTALLEAHDFFWRESDGLIRVVAAQTRLFNVDYLRLSRNGVGKSTATLGSGAAGGTGSGAPGAGGGASGGGASGGSGGSSGGGGSAFSVGSSTVHLTADNQVDFWKEITEEIGSMLTPTGKSSLSINKTAGIIQVTDRPSALKRVENYLASVDKSSHRQVEIEARLYDVVLNDQFQFGIDWVHLAAAYGGVLGFGGATLPVAIGGAQLQDSALGGLNRFGIIGTSASTTPGGNPTTLVFENFNTAAAVTALRQQGKVEVISTPRIRTLNNQTALKNHLPWKPILP